MTQRICFMNKIIIVFVSVFKFCSEQKMEEKNGNEGIGVCLENGYITQMMDSSIESVLKMANDWISGFALDVQNSVNF